MQLSTTLPTTAAASAASQPPALPPIKVSISPNPNFGPQGTGDLLVSAGTGKRYDDMKSWTRLRWGLWHDTAAAPVVLQGGSFDDAVAAARELVRSEREQTKWGLFGRHQGRVDALAVVQAATGFQLLRVDTPVDPFLEPVPGAMTPWQKWRVDPLSNVFEHGDVRRERVDVLALVGATHTFDLRGTRPSTPTEPV